jgi:hypothetical protein
MEILTRLQEIPFPRFLLGNHNDSPTRKIRFFSVLGMEWGVVGGELTRWRFLIAAVRSASALRAG